VNDKSLIQKGGGVILVAQFGKFFLTSRKEEESPLLTPGGKRGEEAV